LSKPHPAGDLAGEGGERGVLAAGHHHLRALVGEASGDHLAHVPRAGGPEHHGGLPLQPGHARLPPQIKSNLAGFFLRA
jgi:hypothetical protein